MQLDLFTASAASVAPCSTCPNLDAKPINPGVHYCWGYMTWRGADERVDACTYRASMIARPPWARRAA